MQTKFLVFLASAALALAQSDSPEEPIYIRSNARPVCIGATQNSNEAPVVSATCGPSRTAWKIEEGEEDSGTIQIKLYGTNLCLRPSEQGSAPLMVATCSPEDLLQMFSISDDGRFVGQDNLCMTLPSQNGEPIAMSSCNGSAVQKWTAS